MKYMIRCQLASEKDDIAAKLIDSDNRSTMLTTSMFLGEKSDL